ncbi:Crinkler effector protein 115 [Phytophthora ramorum]|uniref:Crinkler effector protein 115 n=1 Tax=Phytophthora ramorum TaxID=164328 RepID=UPI0030A94E48|nr:Crinkler effector protein 115 [Phytophthora ramorum]
MVTLFCAVVGVAGSAFSVRVDESDSVDDLKDTIKAENEDIKGPARNLQLFLAKTEGGAWLPGDDSVPLQLDRGGLMMFER